VKLKRAHFARARLTACLLLAPQLAVLALFVFLPGIEALVQAFLLSDPFGKLSQFVGFENFATVLASAQYHNAITPHADLRVLHDAAVHVLGPGAGGGGGSHPSWPAAPTGCSPSGPMPWRR
jgi:ABC-type sugar transport system permease subunit